MKKTNKKPHNPLFSKGLKGKVIFIRHGETNYNIDCLKKGFIIKGDIKYIDGHLNAKGENQAINSSKYYKFINIEDIFVSPLYRTLQTATLIFKNHPNKKNIVLRVHPLLTEIVSSVNNFSWDIDGTKKIYNMNSEIKVDWSIFDNYFKTPEEQNFFFLNYIDILPNPKKEEIKNKIYCSYGTNRVKESIGELGKIIIDLKLKRLESLNHLFKRTCSFKIFLKDKYKYKMNDYNKKIIIISHSCFGQLFTSQECYNKKSIEEYPKDCCELHNCEAISVFI